MATIQIRNVPDAIHRVYQTRAAAAGMSLQEYLLSELECNASLRTPAEIVAETEGRLRGEGPQGFAPTTAAQIIRVDRDSH